MGNGFPIACVVGRADVMKMFEEIFFSFTFAGEVASMAAAMKVLDVLEKTDALATHRGQRPPAAGRLQRPGQAGRAVSAPGVRRPSRTGPCSSSATRRARTALVERSLFAQEVVKRGVLLLVTHNMTAAHDTASHRADAAKPTPAVFKTLGGLAVRSESGSIPRRGNDPAGLPRPLGSNASRQAFLAVYPRRRRRSHGYRPLDALPRACASVAGRGWAGSLFDGESCRGIERQAGR